MMKTLQRITGCVLSVLTVFMVCCICAAGSMDLKDEEPQEVPNLDDILDENDTYPIYTTADFQWFCFYISTGYKDLNGILLDDIDLAGEVSFGQNYCGHFDGNGHTISGIVSELFVELEEGARVENLIVRDANIVSKKYGASGIVWRNFGEIVNCEVLGYIEGKGYTGGIASANYGMIENCVNRADVVSTGDAETYDYAGREIGCGAGGIAGFCGTCEWEDHQTEVKITGCSNYGNVRAEELAGGICARLEDRNNEVAPNNSVQEMVEIDGFSLEEDSENSRDSKSKEDTENKGGSESKGGPESNSVSGQKIDGSLTDCRNYGEVEVEQMTGADGSYTQVAGICGELHWGDICHCANLGKVAIAKTAPRESEDGWVYANRPMAITYNMGFAQSEGRHIVDCISLKGMVSYTMRHENVMEISKEEIPLWETGKLEYLSNSWLFDLEDAVYTCFMEPLHVVEEDSSKEKKNYYLCEEFALCLPEYCEITEQSIGGECYALRICCVGKGAAEDGTGSGFSSGDEAWILRKQTDVEEALTEIHESNTRDGWRVASFAENVFHTIPNVHMLKIDSLSLPGHLCFQQVMRPDKRIYLRNAIPAGSEGNYMGEGNHILGNVVDILLEGNYEDEMDGIYGEGLYAEWIFVFTNRENNIRPSDAFIDLVEEGFYSLDGAEERITIQKEQTLWGIAEEYLASGKGWKMLSAINGIEEPDMIREGEVIRVPAKEAWRKKSEFIDVQWLLQKSE